MQLSCDQACHIGERVALKLSPPKQTLANANTRSTKLAEVASCRTWAPGCGCLCWRPKSCSRPSPGSQGKRAPNARASVASLVSRWFPVGSLCQGFAKESQGSGVVWSRFPGAPWLCLKRAAVEFGHHLLHSPHVIRKSCSRTSKKRADAPP